MKIFKSIAIISTALLLTSLVSNGSFTAFIDYKIFDILSNLSKTQKPPKSVVIVAVDEKSLNILGQWPWNRIITAKISQNILLSKPAVLGLDMLLSEKDRTSLEEITKFYKNNLGLIIHTENVPKVLQDNDQILSSALSARKSVLGTFMNNSNKECDKFSTVKSNGNFDKLAKFSGMSCNYSTLNEQVSGNGFINSKISIDGNLRENVSFANFRGDIVPSLSIAMLMQVDPNLSIKSKKYGIIEVDFLDKKRLFNERGSALNRAYDLSEFKTISAVDVLNMDKDNKIFAGKFVIFGATATGLYDQYLNSDGRLYPGVYYHASFIENFIEDSLVVNPFILKKLCIAAALILCVLLFWTYYKFGYMYTLSSFITLYVLSTLLAFIALKNGIYMSIGYFLLPFLVPISIISLVEVYRGFLENKAHIEDMESANRSTIASMIAVVDSKDGETGGHIVRTRDYIMILCKHLYKKRLYKDIITPDYIEILYRAVPLHDIGKVAIPDNILTKNGKLTDEEMSVMKTHVEKGKEIIDKSILMSETPNKFLLAAKNVVYTHHEKWDGSGYPRGLKGEDIPLEGRLMAIADVYDALVCKRYYKKKYDFEMAEKMIINESGKHFDPTLIKAFEEIKGEFRDIATKIT